MKLDIYEIQVLGLEVHRLASKNPLMLDEQYQSLKEDIRINGQLEPIKLYKGKIADGRHRVKAINELAVEGGYAKERDALGGIIKYVNIPNNTPLSEVEAIINSTETRRMQTKAQLTAAAFKMANESPTITTKEAAIIKGVPANGVAKCARINSKMGSATIDKLIAGEEVVITNANGNVKKTASIQYLYNTLGEIAKKEAEQGKKYLLTEADADRFARRSLKDLSKREAKILALAFQNRAFSMLED